VPCLPADTYEEVTLVLRDIFNAEQPVKIKGPVTRDKLVLIAQVRNGG
jgi:hypothetical protein